VKASGTDDLNVGFAATITFLISVIILDSLRLKRGSNALGTTALDVDALVGVLVISNSHCEDSITANSVINPFHFVVRINHPLTF
jgi:hypothetical protein